MSWSTDLQIVLRGLDKVARAAAGQQQRDLQRFWDNSSLKSATKAVNVQVEEKLSDIVINKDITILQEKLAKATTFSSNFVELMVEQSKAVYSNVKVSGLRDDLASATEDNVQSERTKSSTQIDEHFGMRPDITFDSATAPASSPDMGANTQEASQNQTVLDNAKKAYRPPDEINESRHHKPPRAPPRKPKLYGAKPLGRHSEQHLSDQAKERKVPGSRIGRVFSFGSLAVGLGAGAVAELTRRGLGLQKPKQDGPRAILDHSPFLTHANAERIVSTLCRVRGAALKLGQMISIQDNSLINPELQAIFERVRQSADFMPSWQMKKVLVQELGEDWRNKLEGFEEKPFAAASIGQVHAGTLLDGRQVAMKIQYPGVADSIDSDIDNLMTLLNTTRILPEGMHLDSTMRVARTELGWECDYIREAECSKRFRKLLEADPVLYVPDVIDDLTSRQVLTTELVNGLPLDKIDNIDQDIKDWIAENILRLCLTEVFEFRFMQTDPNWANFLYDAETGRITLLDFGASREYSRKFVDQYIRVIKAASLGDRKGVLLASQKLGFLTGYESKAMENAHIDAVLILGESFAEEGKFDFGGQNTAARIHNLVPVMLKHRLTAPPEETYSLHRKMAGCFLLCSKLKANIECKPLFDSIWASYRFETEDSDLEYLLTR